MPLRDSGPWPTVLYPPGVTNTPLPTITTEVVTLARERLVDGPP